MSPPRVIPFLLIWNAVDIRMLINHESRMFSSRIRITLLSEASGRLLKGKAYLSVTMNHPLAFALGLVGNIISFMVYLAPLPTFIRVYRKKSTEDFHSIPYVAALFSAMFWIYYGLIKGDCILILTINSAGCIIETLYLAFYVAYAPTQAKIVTANLLVSLNVGVFGSVVLFTLLFTQGQRRVLIVGWISSVISVTVYAAPLSVLRLVICTRSAEFMPFYLSFFLTVSATIWFAYGLLIQDKFVALPNVLGFLFGILQMIVYVLYRNAKQVNDENAIDLPGINGKLNSIGSAEIHPIDIHLQRPCDDNDNDKSTNSTVHISIPEVDRKQSESIAV